MAYCHNCNIEVPGPQMCKFGHAYPFHIQPERLVGSEPTAIESMRAQLLLIRVTLGLSPVHDPVTAVRVLYEEGKEAFEALRGEPCQHAASWKPSYNRGVETP